MQRITCLLLFVLICAATSALQAQGVLTFETEAHDFGSVMEGEKPTFIFRFTNTGDEDATVTHVQPSCGCTAPSYSTEPVAPNELGEITIEYNSQGRPGDFNKTISVQSSGTAGGYSTLRITGTVIPVDIQNGVVQGSVVFDADTHTFSDLHAGSTASHTFRMQNMGQQPLAINEARTFDTGVEVAFPDRLIFPGEIVDVYVSIDEPAAVLNRRGALDVAIVLATDDADLPTKSLRLRGQLHAEDEVSGTQTSDTQ